MRRRVLSALLLVLILVSTLNLAFIVRPSFGEKGIIGKGSPEKTEERPLLNETGKLDQAGGFDSSQPNIFERKTETGQTSSHVKNKWNFNDTSGWSDFTYVDGNKTRLIVGVNSDEPTSLLKLEKIVATYQAQIVSTVTIASDVRALVVELLLPSVTSFVEEVRAAGLASYVEPNMKIQAQFVPNDPYWNVQWAPQKIGADWAWNTTVGNSSLLVAVIDTGIYYYHNDLAANYVPLGYDWVNMDANPLDDNGHGTHCAGIIAAVLNNSIGIAGLAQVRVMAEKVLTSSGSGYTDWVANGIIHATDKGADIISMSLGGYSDSELLHEAIRYAYDHGVLVIAAAGNDDTSVRAYPAGYDEVIAVAATDQYDNKAWWSNWGDWIELAAPGVEIYSTVPLGYASESGTSMACPHVAGVAALIWSLHPDKTRDWVRLWLRYTADDLGDNGFDVYYGYGRVNARKAVEQASLQHELIAYEWRTPPYVEPGALTTVNATILNFGKNNETNIMVRLLANGSMVYSTLVDFLSKGNLTTINLLWNPEVEGLYNVTLSVEPVPGETNIENNVLWKYIYVGVPVKAVVLHSAGTFRSDVITNWQVLNNDWRIFGDTMVYIDYTTLNKEDITYEDIVATKADVLIISCAYDPSMGWQFIDSEIEAITRYVYEGHGLIATAGTLNYWVPNNNKLAPLFGLRETITWDSTQTDLLHFLNITHPLFRNVPNPFVFAAVGTNIPLDSRWDSNKLEGGKYLALGHYQESAIVTYRGLVYISPWLEVIPPYYHYHLQLLYNAITWSRYQKPQHELVVSLEAPKYLKPDQSTLLNATVSNGGLSNETNVILQILINGTVFQSATVPEFLAGGSYTISYLWTPAVRGMYSVTAYALPVPGEDNIQNNIKSARVILSAVVVALFQNLYPWDYPSNEEALDHYGVPYVVFGAIDFGKVDLSVFTKVVIASDQDQSFYNAMDIYRWWFEDYVNNGGILEIHASDRGWHGGSWIGLLPGGLGWTGQTSDYVRIVDFNHIVITTPNPISGAELYDWRASVHGYFSTYPADSHIVIIEEYSGQPVYLEFKYGSGMIVASSQNLEWALKHRYSLILENSLLYMVVKYQHDVAVVSVTPSANEVRAGNTVDINVTVENQGNFTENSRVTALASIQNNSSATAYSSSLGSPRIYFDPSNYIFSSGTVSVGYRFNVTVKVADVENLVAWQVGIYYDSSIIRATRWFEPTWDPQYVFYGKPTFSTGDIGINYAITGAVVFSLESFNGTGKLSIIEFEVAAVPSEGETYSANLNIRNRDTFLVDPDNMEIPSVKENGYYELSWASSLRYIIGVANVLGLGPGERRTLMFTWNSTGVLPGVYEIYAKASLVPSEGDTVDNMCYDGVITVMPNIVHDVAVIGVSVPSNIVYQGWVVGVNVTVVNLGNGTDTFNVTLYYDHNVIAIQSVQNLGPNATLMLNFIWDTTNVPCCNNYTVKAVASIVPEETNVTNNEFIYGQVKVRVMGDVNGDGIVNILDIYQLVLVFRTYPGRPNWKAENDLDRNGVIDIRDINIAVRNFNKKC